MTSVHDITKAFEQKLCDYTGAPFAVAVDNCSNALFLALKWYRRFHYKCEVTIPYRTYPSVPCSVIHADFTVKFEQFIGTTLKGPYQLKPTPVWDCALRFTKGMYVPGQFQCLSFTGPRKILKLSKGGAILTDDAEAAAWFRKARYSGRNECDYNTDTFDMLGWNMYMLPEIAARGLLLMQAFPDYNPDVEIMYPDLSKYKIYTDVP
jgi:dTDP-4-amino-4,6-dideoxygalactose transaminase